MSSVAPSSPAPSSPMNWSTTPGLQSTSETPVPTNSSSYFAGADETLVFGLTAALFASLAVFVSTFLLVSHLKHYTIPNHQRYIIRILLMVPLYAFYSVASIFFYKYHSYFSLLRDCYEAYVLYCFLSLCINYGGGFDNLALRLAASSPFPLAFPFQCCTVQPGKRRVLQYTLVRPLTALIAIILQSLHKYEDGVINFTSNASFVYISLIVNVSMTAALYCLVFFYQAAKEELAPYRPLLKFVCIKFVLFFSYWQWIAVVLLVQLGAVPKLGKWDSGQLAAVIQNVLICIEMLIAAIMHIRAFPADAYALQSSSSKAPLIHETTEMGSWLKSVTDSAIPRDVLRDTVDSFVPEMLRGKPHPHSRGTSALYDEPLDEENDRDHRGQQLRSLDSDSRPDSPVPSSSSKPLGDANNNSRSGSSSSSGDESSIGGSERALNSTSEKRK